MAEKRRERPTLFSDGTEEAASADRARQSVRPALPAEAVGASVGAPEPAKGTGPARAPVAPPAGATQAGEASWRLERRDWTGTDGTWGRAAWQQVAAGTEAACRAELDRPRLPDGEAARPRMADFRLWHGPNIVLQVTR